MSSTEDLEQTRRMIKGQNEFEMRIGHNRLIDWSRLPQTIKRRRLLKTYTYKLEYGYEDDTVFISYFDESKPWGDKNKVLMHYNESTLEECISKAWRNLAEHRVKL